MNRKELVAVAEAVARLEAIDAKDAERAHGQADDVLLKVLKVIAPEVAQAYVKVMDRAPWWGSA